MKLPTDLANLNWKFLKHKGELTTRSVIEYFENKFLEPGVTKKKMYQEYVKKAGVKEKLANWNFSETDFIEAAINFYKRVLSEKAHPKWLSGDTLIIPTETLMEIEWKVLGAIWELVPLRKNSLAKRNTDGSLILVTDLKSIQDY